MISTANKTKVSIIITSSNVREYLKKYLTFVFDNNDKEKFDVIVSDSNSINGTTEMIAEHIPWVLMGQDMHI
ncbi:MAG: glycosyltransferase [Candidatus Hodarchaeota archaeon]